MHMGHDHSHSHGHEHKHQDEGSPQTLSTFGVLIQPRPKLKRNLLISAGIVLAASAIRRKVTKLDLGLFVIISCVLSGFETAKGGVKAWINKINQIGQAVARHSTPLTARYFFKNDNAADRVTLLGVVINIVLSITKFIGGIKFNSAVLVADAGHSLSDLLSDFICLYAVQVARLPADDDHPFGHGKFESVGSLFLSLTLLATGLSIGAWSYEKMIGVLHLQSQQSFFSSVTAAVSTGSNSLVQAVHSAAAGGQAHIHVASALPSWPALALAFLSITSKEWLYRVTRRVGEALNSQIIIANAWHHRSDAFSSILSFGSIAVAITMPQLLAVDPAAGIFVAGMICLTGVDVLIESVKELVDTNDKGVAAAAVAAATQSGIEGVVGVKSVRARTVGSGKNLVELTVITDKTSSFSASQSIAEKVRWKVISTLPNVIDASVRTTPSDEDGVPFCPLLGEGQASPSEVESKVRRCIDKAKSGATSGNGWDALKDIARVTVHYIKTTQVHTDVCLRVQNDPNVTMEKVKVLAASVRKTVLDAKAADTIDVMVDLSS